MHILLILDGSPAVMAEAIQLATERGANLTALFIIDYSWGDYIGHDWLSGSNARMDFLEYVNADEQRMAKAALSDFETCAIALRKTGRNVVGRITWGRVVQEIRHELAQGYDLLVLPWPFNRGLEALRKDVDKLIREVSCSIFFVAS
ncbi:Universal stress protein UspA [Desulfovibrionales bacterium]